MFLHLFVGVNCMLDFQMGRHKIKCVPHLHLTFLQSRCTYHSKQSQKVFGSVYMRILLKKRCGIRRHFAKMHFQKISFWKIHLRKKIWENTLTGKKIEFLGKFQIFRKFLDFFIFLRHFPISTGHFFQIHFHPSKIDTRLKRKFFPAFKTL